MRQSATELDERTYSGTKPGTERSLRYIALLLLGARYFSLFMGVAYFLWKLTAFFWTDQEATTQELLVVWLISALIPGVAWIVARWGERLAREASRAQAELMAANQRAQSEIAQRQQAEAALRESQQKAQRLAAENGLLADIGRIISASPNISDVYEPFAEEVRKLIPFDRIAIALVDSDNTAIAPYVTGINVPSRLQGSVIPLAGSVTDEVVRTRGSVLIHPETEDEVTRRFPSLLPIFRAGLRSMMAVPLIASNRVIGVLNIQSLTPNCYTESDVALARSVAAQIAGAIANARLHAQVEREARERAALAEIGRIVSSSLDINQVYERFAEQVRTVIPFDRILVSVVDVQRGVASHEYQLGVEVPGRRRGEAFPLAGTMTETVIRTRSGLLVQTGDELEVAERFPGLLPVFRSGARSFVSAPLISKGEAIGALHLAAERLGVYTERDVTLAEQIGAQIAGAIASARLHNELRQYTDALARSNADLEQFAYIASHDLQEPLRMVSSYTQLLARRYQGRLDADADEFIGYAVDGASRMQRLIADLLTYSRVSTRGRELEPVNTEAVFDEAVSNLRMAIEESNASVTHEGLPVVKADGTQLGQVFQNLIGNAIKFRRPEEPPRVHVSAKLDGKEWVFSVRDNGIGIAPEFIGRLFVIFQRLHTRDEYPGTGIGLAVCKKIVERHGGRIWVESEPGRGSTFYFTIPADKG